MRAMSRRGGLLLAAGVVAFAALTTLVGNASGAPLRFLVLDLATGMTFVVAGLAAVWLRPGSPTGPALLVSGALWYVGSYAPTGRPALTELGFAFETYYDLVLAALLLVLSSPVSRLQPRVLIVAMAAAMVVRSLGRLVFVDASIFGCEDCPPNPFALWPSLAAFEAVEIVTNFAIAGLAAGVGFVVLRRLLRAGPVLRRARWPILAAGGLAMGGAALDKFEYGWTTLTQAPLFEVPEPWSEVLGWLGFVLRALVPMAFLLVTVRLRAAPGPLGPFAARLEASGDAGTTGDVLRTVLGDPSLVLLRADDAGRWTGEDGAPAAPLPLQGRESGRAVTRVGHEDRPLAAIVHDPALLDQPELLVSVVRVLRLALENERLEGELRDQLAAVTESRERIVSAAEDERRRVERDLHDGAQQRLVGVMLSIQQARAIAEAGGPPDALRAQLDAVAGETSEAMRELRELARGIHPAILEDEGLAAAVGALARRSGVPVDVDVDLARRPPRLVESTAYFTIAEALTNAQRHAHADHVSVRVRSNDGALELEVADDGAGGADPDRGSGLRGLADRVAAVGGRLAVDSPSGSGTRVRATIPAP